MKVEKNFSCNGIRKKKGDSLSNEEMEKMRDHLDHLLAHGFLLGSKMPEKKEEKKADKKPEKKAEKKPKKEKKLFKK